jgi:predicted dehydrogenase
MFRDASVVIRKGGGVRFGLVGSGMAGPLFHGALATRPGGAELHGIAASSPESARSAAARWQVPRAYDGWQDLIADPTIEAVCIATPTGTHAEISVAASRAGKHVLVEKPIATSLDEADAMIEAASAAGRALGVIFMYRFMDTARLMKRAIDGGHLGTILFAEVRGHFWRDQAYYDSGTWRGTWAGEGGGSLMSQTSHTLDLLLWMLGPVASVHAYVDRTPVHDIETEDIVAGALRFESGALATILSTTAAAAPLERALVVSGTTGCVELRGDRLARFEAPGLEEDAAILARASDRDRGDTTRAAGYSDSELHRRQLEDFVEACAQGRPPAVDGQEGRRTLEVMRSLYRSAQSGTVVGLPLGSDPRPGVTTAAPAAVTA